MTWMSPDAPSTENNLRSHNTKMMRTRFGIVAIVGVVAIVGIAGLNGARMIAGGKQQCSGQRSTYKVEKNSIDATVRVSGFIHPIKEVRISPETAGLIEKVLVKQGDQVKAGDVLVQMDDADVRGQVESA